MQFLPHRRPAWPTRRLLTAIALFLGIAGSSQQVFAAEPFLEFLDGLRTRGYYDSALLYLDQMEASKTLPEDARKVLPFERGQTLLESAKTLQNLDSQRKQLDAAQAAFEAFVKASPNHEFAGRANTARGQILMEKARVDIWDGDKPSNEGNRAKLRQSARNAIASAQKIFEEAKKQHEATWRKFPAYIPEEQKAERAARDAAEEQFIRSQLDLAQCTYWNAQTYDKGSPERKKLLQDAAIAFEVIHQKYRSQLGGLFARIWQGKCFEEQGDAEGIRIALGIYGEILEHEGSTPAMRNLRDRALRFRLICLNTTHRNDYQLVIQEAEQWLKEARERVRTDVGLGIQWELCRAQEALGTDRNIPEATRKNYLTQALNRARNINRYPGELKNPSSGLIQRILVLMNRDPSDPKDFDTAYGNGGQLYEQVSVVNSQIRKLQAEGKQKEALAQYESLMATSAEMTRMYDLALKLAQPASDPLMVNTARLRLAYGYLLQKRDYEAAIIAEDQMLRHGDENSEFAKEAGFLMMAAFDHAYSAAPEGQRDFEERQVIAAANQICDRWPESDRANDARNTVAKIFWNNNELLTAAEWWQKIPKGTAQYADAQVRAGKAFWRQYVTAVSNAEESAPKAEDLNKWKEAAISHLTTGINEAQKTVPAGTPLSDDLIGAKLTLVNIRNLDGLFEQKDPKGPPGSLDLLLKDPHPVLKAVDVPKGQKRPTDPAKATSRQMASFAYQQLLRAYIGTNNLEEANKARTKLEEVAAGGDEAALTQVFVDFGRELERELDRLRLAGDTNRLNSVRAGFESFLNDLLKRKEGQTLYSLLWIGETFGSLAEGSSDNPAKAEDFYKKAAGAYQSIIESAAKDPKFATAPQITATKLRMVNSLRNQKDFPKAQEVIVEVLKTSPNAPDAQFEAAQLYQSWAQATGEADKFNIALYGQKTPEHIWGWTYTAQSLQQALFRQKEERIEKLHFDARYNQAEAEKLFGLALSDVKESRLHFDRALSNINSFQRVSKRWPDEEYQRFNALYRSVLAEIGEPVIDLPRELASTEPSSQAPAQANNQPAAADTTSPQTAAQAPAAAAPKKEEGSPAMMILILVVSCGGAIGVWIVSQKMRKNQKHASISTAGGEPVLPPAGASFAPPAVGPPQIGPGHSAGHAKKHSEPAGPAFPSFDSLTESAPAARKPAPRPVAPATATAKPAAPKPAATAAKVAPTAAKPAAPRPAAARPEGQPRPVAKPGAPTAAPAPGAGQPVARKPQAAPGAAQPSASRPAQQPAQPGAAKPQPAVSKPKPPAGDSSSPAPRPPKSGNPPTPPNPFVS